MPVYPIEWVPPALLGGYPNMQRRDQSIWEAWLRSAPIGVKAVAYNVALGGQVPADPSATQAQLQGWAYSTAVKVDAVVDFGEVWWFCEVKPSAQLGAVGQALGYVVMAEKEGLFDGPMLPAIITDSVSPDLLYICDQLDVQLVVVGQLVPDTSSLPYPVGAPAPVETHSESSPVPRFS